jgi:glycosyltransferase involved in cell wall biosynthesis
MTFTLSKKISFIIASVDRDEQLQCCITSIEKAHQYAPDILIEILVVIQNKQKKNLKVSYPHITSLYYIDQRGLSVARNFAIKNSTGDYLVFLDDDAAVSENFIEVLSAKVLLYKNVNAFCGRLIDSKQDIPFSTLFYSEELKKLGWVDYQYFMGSAHVLSASILKHIGCYDERFGVGARYYGSEESDIFFRLKAAGEQVFYLPELVFFHPIPDNPPDYVYKYAYAIAAMLIKNCMNDKKHMIIYCYLVLQRLAKACVRIMQMLILKGVYVEKDKKYHYGSLVKGTLRGINDFITQEL